MDKYGKSVIKYPTLSVLFVLGFYGPVNNEVMLSRPVNSGLDRQA